MSRAGGRANSRLSASACEQLVGVAGVHAVDVQVTGDVGAGEPQIAEPGGEVGRAARGLEVQAERRVGRARRAAVVGREPQRQPTAREHLQNLGERELPLCRSPGARHRG